VALIESSILQEFPTSFRVFHGFPHSLSLDSLGLVPGSSNDLQGLFREAKQNFQGTAEIQ